MPYVWADRAADPAGQIPGDSAHWSKDDLRPGAATGAGGEGGGAGGAGGERDVRRRCVLAYAAKDNQTRRNGVHIWDDYRGL